MIPIYIERPDMANWMRRLDDMPRQTNSALANALNSYGEDTVRSWSEALADNYGIEAGAVRNLIKVQEASPQRLEFSADASAVVQANPEWLRPWAERDQKAFEQDTLVKIVMVEDHFNCEICQEAAAKSPYTLREINAMAAKWAHFHAANGPALGDRTNLIHPNCRCSTQPWTATRRMKMTFGGKGVMPQELMTARQLGERVADELKLAIKLR